MELLVDRTWFKNSPLIEGLYFEAGIPISRYPVDSTWDQKRLTPWRLNTAGFNPFEERVFIAQVSGVESFLRGKKKARECGPDFMFDVITVAHDMLHIVAYRWMAEFLQERNLLEEIRKKGSIVEDFLFIHLVSETAAIVGLDYWYLCHRDVNELFDAGASFYGGFGTKFSPRVERDIQIFNPDFKSGAREFFHQMLDFYCDGPLKGISTEVLDQSPIIKEWVTHELTYAELQRKYVRDWFTFLQGGEGTWSSAHLAPRSSWQNELASFVSDRLYRLVRNGETSLLKLGTPLLDMKSLLFGQGSNRLDPRFNHVDLFPEDYDGPDRLCFIHNYIRRYEYASFLPSVIKSLGKIDASNFQKVQRLFGLGKKLEPLDDVPRHIFFPA